MVRTIITALVASTLAVSAATTLVAIDNRHDAEAQRERDRVEACQRREAIVDAFDAYTDALIAAGEGTERTPEEQAAYDERVAAFRVDLAERLAPLEPTDC